MRALPFLGERPALAIAGRPDHILDGFLEAHRAAFNEDEASVCAGEERESGVEDLVGHGVIPLTPLALARPYTALFQRGWSADASALGDAGLPFARKGL